MRPLLPLAGALLTACAARALPVPEPDLPMAARPSPTTPREGRSASDLSREVRLLVEVGDRRVPLHAWCRVGVWTTLQEQQPESFVIRESWGRLGTRPPRRLARVEDEVIGGVVARLRPERDGSLSFRVEASSASANGSRKVGDYSGQEVRLGDPRRYGYRFAGRAPAGHRGVVARWPGGVSVRLKKGPDELEPNTDPSMPAGLVVGDVVEAEAFEEEWVFVKPVAVRADGVERMDFRLERTRRAAGFNADGKGWYNSYGATFEFVRSPGLVRFAAGRRAAHAR